MVFHVREELCSLQGASFHANSYAASAAVAEQIDAGAASLNVLFVSSGHELNEVERAWLEADPGPTICCTTAGEVCVGQGHVNGAVVGASIRGVRAEVWTLEELDSFDEPDAQRLRLQMEPFLASVTPSESINAVVLLDGLSRSEERVVAALHHALEGIPMVGGSAGDDLTFAATHVMVEGELRQNVGAIVLIATAAPAFTFMMHHFEPTDQRLVVTAADPIQRRVMELDGMPASEAYREACGVGAGPLSKEQMAVAPLMLAIGERTYVRSIAGEAGGALEMYCAIEEGLVLQLGRPTSMVERLDRLMTQIDEQLGAPQLVLGFDCILRRLEMEHFGISADVQASISGTPFVGFSTYGEIFGGLHVNQTLTGIAFGQ